tara:strand:- start:28881 stop:29924 length:1044 start_codon:yes stop_codon:yes gene_type:complete
MTEKRTDNADKMRDFMTHFSEMMDRHFTDVLADQADIAVGVSGGADSVALCYALSKFFAHDTNRTIHALSVDHGLREEAQQEAQHVQTLLQELPNVRHSILTWDHTDKPTSRIQERARRARYDLMHDYMAAHDLSCLFVGHHMDDQAETFLFRLAKGSGLDGLGGMPFIQELNARTVLCRPLLEMGKAEIVYFCKAEGIAYIDDPSNQCDDYARVRLRKSMDVLAVEGLTPKRLSVTAKRLYRGRDALDYVSENEYKKCTKAKDSNRIVLDVDLLLIQPFDIVLRVMLRAIAALSPDQDYGARLERVEHLCEDLMKPEAFRKRTLNKIIFDCNTQTREILLSREHCD